MSFAGGGPNTRSTQIFIAFEDLNFLGKEPWETPFGVVTSGEDTLNKLYKGYGDIPPFGKGILACCMYPIILILMDICVL